MEYLSSVLLAPSHDFPGLRPASPTLFLMPDRPHSLFFPGCGLLLRHFSSCLAGRIPCFSLNAACFSGGMTPMYADAKASPALTSSFHLQALLVPDLYFWQIHLR
jgi:hypothetical protein